MRAHELRVEGRGTRKSPQSSNNEGPAAKRGELWQAMSVVGTAHLGPPGGTFGMKSNGDSRDGPPTINRAAQFEELAKSDIFSLSVT